MQVLWSSACSVDGTGPVAPATKDTAHSRGVDSRDRGDLGGGERATGGVRGYGGRQKDGEERLSGLEGVKER